MLTGVERFARKLLMFANEHAAPKWLQYKFLRTVSQAWVYRSMHRRMYLDGADWLSTFSPDRGVVLASNHRSFFDQYIAMLGLYEAGVPWARRIFFPIRSDFFYERPAGVALNLLVGGGVMYPPVFRDPSKADYNKDAVNRLIGFLQHSGTLVGVHPEGTRNKGDDPYELLPAKPGIGEIILKSNAVVIPLFLNGLSNDFLNEIRRNYHPKARQLDPVIACYGQPVDYSEFATKKPRAALYKRTADKVREAIAKLSEKEKMIRAACERGEISPDAPNWLDSHHAR